jgi:hypothetical protein
VCCVLCAAVCCDVSERTGGRRSGAGPEPAEHGIQRTRARSIAASHRIEQLG